jgi:putative transposase
VFTNDILTVGKHASGVVRAELDVDLVEFNGETDHLHLLVAYPAVLAISTLTQRLKG